MQLTNFAGHKNFAFSWKSLIAFDQGKALNFDSVYAGKAFLKSSEINDFLATKFFDYNSWNLPKFFKKDVQKCNWRGNTNFLQFIRRLVFKISAKTRSLIIVLQEKFSRRFAVLYSSWTLYNVHLLNRILSTYI